VVPFTLETGLHPKRPVLGNHGVPDGLPQNGEDEIQKAEQYETRKLMLLHLLEDPILDGVADLAYAEQRPAIAATISTAMDIGCRVHAVTQRPTRRPQGQRQSAEMARVASANIPLRAERAPIMAALRAI